MEGVLQALGVIGLVLLAVIGLLAGLIASLVAGGDRGKYIVIGIAAAIAAPFVLALVGIGVIAAYGVAAILVAAIIGAGIVLLIVHVLSGDRAEPRN
jgi:uncharacterized membrane protein YeaQ/YmgE (transglycosylase-associated protein family)